MKLERPLVSIDTETTGPKPECDRVIEVGLVVLRPDGTRTPLRWLINPGCPIPAESTAIHHITDAQVAGAPRFEEVAYEIAVALIDVDLVGYNLRAFDIPILKREFEMAGRPWPFDGHVYDAFVVFKEREPHKLTTAMRRYVGRELVDAHSAVADAEATLDVSLAQIALYPDLAAMDFAALELASGGRRPDWATELGHLRWRDDGDLYIAFGKHDGRKLIDMDDGFLRWITGKDFPEDVKDLVWAVRRGDRPRAPGAPALPEQRDSDDPDDCDDCDDDWFPDPATFEASPTLAPAPGTPAFDDIPF